MAFNTALSGLRAANSDLSVIGHNIANASTVGFKHSRAEFADIYANSVLGSGSVNIGSGVTLPAVTQQFAQGNISFTNNGLDLAINGQGFFVLNEDGAVSYSRAGQIQLDRDGFLISNQGKRIQGFQASPTGAISGVLSDVQINSDNQPPQLTTLVEAAVNLDARETPVAFGNRASDGSAIGVAQGGPPSSNGYAAETLTFTAIDGSNQVFNVTPGDSANLIALGLQALGGVDASATTTANLNNINPQTAGFSLSIDIGTGPIVIGSGVSVTPQSLANQINTLSDTLLPGVTAVAAGSQLVVSSDRGDDLSFAITGGVGDSVDVFGVDSPATVITIDPTTATTEATVGGSVTLAVDEDLAVTSSLMGTGLFATDPNDMAAPFDLALQSSFNPNDPDTFNHATSLTVFDSLGVPHIMTAFFVKESDLSDTVVNRWRMYVQIDGEDVGDPNPNGPNPAEPTVANFSLIFDSDGSLNETISDDILISNWTPLDANGNPNGSLGPETVAQGGTTNIPDPPTSSNFVIDLEGTTQFGSTFAVSELDQNGFTTGRLAGLDIGKEGIIFARFTNGQSLVLGQIALADFANEQGLSPIGDTAWAETFESGPPVIGTPGSGALGVIQSGALEDSTTELSEELVALIIAQRNFQANAQTIQTADTVTQTIINIR